MNKIEQIKDAITEVTMSDYISESLCAESIDVIVEVLQEKLKNKNGCEYCKDYNNPKSYIRQDEDFCSISYFKDRRGDKTGGFNYCPICGRKL